MDRRVVGTVLLLVVIAAAFWMLRSSGDLPGPGDSTIGGADPATALVPTPPEERVPSKTPAVEGLPPNTVATRVAAAGAVEAELAAAPTAWLQVLDRITGKAVEGAAVRSVQGGVEMAFTDANGLAPLPLLEPQQLAVIADGYLLRLVPAQLDSSERQPQQTQLVRDRWSHRLRLRLATGKGPLDGDAWVQFRLLEPPGTVLAPTSEDAVVKRAFREHTMLARLPVGGDLPIEDGVLSPLRTHRLTNDATVGFVTAGVYELRVATPAGLVAQREVVIPALAGDATELTVTLQRGETLRGQVVAADGERLSGATVQLQGGDPLGLLATTDANGAFALGPLVRGTVQLHVHHFDREPLAFGPVATGASDVRITLQPLPASVIRGRVRARPQLTPIADAVVVWTTAGGAPITTRTDSQGRFALRTTGAVASRLLVQAQGHVPYAELVEPGAPFADYDVLPAIAAVRVAQGMSTLLCGAVVDARGQPIVGLPVRWVPDAPSPPQGFPGRRALEGAVLELPGLMTTGVDGAFALETNQFGGGRVCLPDDVAAPSRGVRLEAIAGETKNGLVLRR